MIDNRRKTLLLASIVLAGLASAAGGGQTDARPNILLVTADNLGYGDLPVFNRRSRVRAPHFEQLAAEGGRLTQFYTASPTCSVSRACLLTGRVAARHGLTNQLPGVEGNYGRGLNPTERLMPQLLKQAGYATGCFGKWNIGFAPGSRPTERGFEEFFGHASGNIDYYTHNYNHKHDLYRGIQEAHVSGYATDLFADAAIDFIRRRSRQPRPWFVYLAFNAPHCPNPKNKWPGEPVQWQAPPSAFEAYGYDPQTSDESQRYQAVLTALDSALGRVLAVLDELGEVDNTFVFFFSDNGAFMRERCGGEVASNAPLRGGGVTCWEGGLRIAALARWPGHIDAGTIVDVPLWSPDLFVATARLAGVELPRDRVLDGRDPLPVLTEGSASPHRAFFFQFRKHAALRQGDWKIVRTRPDQPWMLFDLASDIGEQHDVAGRFPERREALAEEFTAWQQRLARDASRESSADPSDDDTRDPLYDCLAPELTSMVDVVLHRYRGGRKYPESRFPLPSAAFAAFRQEAVARLTETLHMQDWVVRGPAGKQSPLADRFHDRVLKVIHRDGVSMELHVVRIGGSGLVVPMVVCLPPGSQRAPGVCVFSGHTQHGLRDLTWDRNSYQQGMAVRLAQNGFVTIAVEKIDSGYLSRDGRRGTDEKEVTTTWLHWGQVTRAHQLQACLAASEILAVHPRVDEDRIGATGVSLGGWLSVQTALLSDRIGAVADFGRKTLAVPPGITSDEFAGQRDLCHILPGMLALCDRNVLALAYCPRPLLAGHGRQDEGSQREGPEHFEALFRDQYAALGAGGDFQYLVHEQGDEMPADVVVRWFQNRWGAATTAGDDTGSAREATTP